MDTVSVILAVKNESLYIIEALKSIKDQENIIVEIIIVDDHSTDDTIHKIKPIVKDNSNIRFYTNPGLGKVSAFNFGIEQSTSEYLCLFAGDDVMPEKSLKKRIQSISSFDKDLALVGLSKLITLSDNPSYNNKIIPKSKDKGNTSGACIMMNRTASQMIFPIPAILPNEDTWMELVVNYNKNLTVINSNTIACIWRIHSNNSINPLLEDFETFNKKYSRRMYALELFLNTNPDVMHEKSKVELKNKILAEKYRIENNIWGLLFVKINLKEKLKLILISNSMNYYIRKKIYRYLGGL